jgi:hypothetical protein
LLKFSEENYGRGLWTAYLKEIEEFMVGFVL